MPEQSCHEDECVPYFDSITMVCVCVWVADIKWQPSVTEEGLSGVYLYREAFSLTGSRLFLNFIK